MISLPIVTEGFLYTRKDFAYFFLIGFVNVICMSTSINVVGGIIPNFSYSVLFCATNLSSRYVFESITIIVEVRRYVSQLKIYFKIFSLKHILLDVLMIL